MVKNTTEQTEVIIKKKRILLPKLSSKQLIKQVKEELNGSSKLKEDTNGQSK